MIEFGCCSLNFEGMDLKSTLRLIAGLGFKYADVEVCGSTAQVNQLEAAAEPERVGETLRSLGEEIGLQLAEFFVIELEIDGQMVTPVHRDDGLIRRSLEQFRHLCLCAQVSGCRSIMTVPGSPADGGAVEAVWDRGVSTLRQMAAIAGNHGLRFHVEPHSGSIGTTPELALRLGREVDGLSFVLDYAHFIGQGIPQEEVTPLLDFTGHMHAKPCGLGQGKILVHEMTIDFKAILAELLRRDWDGIISMECIRPAEAANISRTPGVQNALMAHRLELMLAELTGAEL